MVRLAEVWKGDGKRRKARRSQTRIDNLLYDVRNQQSAWKTLNKKRDGAIVWAGGGVPKKPNHDVVHISLYAAFLNAALNIFKKNRVG